ncbi:hypothetical protein ACFPM3_18130 [Streptomyces coeruleoprunus]|uniref:Uncharacterized protein n=1 Tax=Streptomyces coeruleoprunus TaxID=285563 RepID=A0ABV9XH37_9ACTN
MIILSLDTTSTSYAAGQSMGAFLVTGAVMALVWRVTRSWRRADAPQASVPEASLPALRAKRRKIVQGVLVLIAAAGFIKAVSVYNPEPRAAQAGADTNVAPGELPRRTIAPPAQLRHYHLVTGKDVAALEAAMPRRAKSQQARGQWWYYVTETHGVAGILSISTVEQDPQMAADKRRNSFTQEFRNMFAGAKARDTAFFDAGPLPGRLGCGHFDIPTGEAALCAWSDAYTTGTLILTDTQDLAEAAQITRELRTATDRRS